MALCLCVLERGQGVARRPEGCEEIGSAQDKKQTWFGVLRERIVKNTVGWVLHQKLEAWERSCAFYLPPLVDSVRAGFSGKGGGYCGISWQRLGLTLQN